MCPGNLRLLAVTVLLLLLLQSPGYQSVLFIHSYVTTNFLADIVNFEAKSKVECASHCHRKMNGNACTAFALNTSANLCTCGKKRFAPVEETSTDITLHIASKCPKVKTGEKFKYILWYRKFQGKQNKSLKIAASLLNLSYFWIQQIPTPRESEKQMRALGV